jgi:predicted amidohydrolase
MKIAFERKTRKVRVSVVSQLWNDEGRSLSAVLEKIAEAAADRADIVALPQECVKTDGEPIPGPISSAIAEAAKKHKMYVIGNIREQVEDGALRANGDKTYVTSFLCDREGKIVGKYRKSHKMPDEDMALGDDLPVFDTDFGQKIAMRIGTDRFFPDIDHVYTVKGARIIFWSQMPEPVEDEYTQDFPSEGRAADYQVFIACSRYAAGKPGYITNKFPPYCGFPIGRAYVINKEGQRIASTPRTGGGVATAVIPVAQLTQGRAKPKDIPGFAALSLKLGVPEKPKYAKRRIRISIIESGLPIDQLLVKLDEAGKIGSDIVCLYELVWFPCSHEKMNFTPKELEERIKRAEPAAKKAKENLARVAEKAKQYKMYVLIAGVVERIERNEAILFDRDGNIVWRYFKVAKTHGEQIPGDDTPVYDTDFGRIAARICADEWMVELDRCYGVKGADIVFFSTQSWGPDALLRDLRDISRAMDTGTFLVECTHHCSEVRHRSMIVDPTGVVVARSEYNKPSLVTAVVDLDTDRPLRYIRRYKPHKPGGYLPEFQPDQMPESANDLREVILQQRRPELYGVLAVGVKPQIDADKRP